MHLGSQELQVWQPAPCWPKAPAEAIDFSIQLAVEKHYLDITLFSQTLSERAHKGNSNPGCNGTFFSRAEYAVATPINSTPRSKAFPAHLLKWQRDVSVAWLNLSGYVKGKIPQQMLLRFWITHDARSSSHRASDVMLRQWRQRRPDMGALPTQLDSIFSSVVLLLLQKKVTGTLWHQASSHFQAETYVPDTFSLATRSAVSLLSTCYVEGDVQTNWKHGYQGWLIIFLIIKHNSSFLFLNSNARTANPFKTAWLKSLRPLPLTKMNCLSLDCSRYFNPSPPYTQLEAHRINPIHWGPNLLTRTQKH